MRPGQNMLYAGNKFYIMMRSLNPRITGSGSTARPDIARPDTEKEKTPDSSNTEKCTADSDYLDKMESMMDDPRILQMKQFHQHRNNNTYNHVCHVARMSYRISKKLHLKVNEDSMLRGAMLHDYYLYDFMRNPIGAYRHGTTHPEKALDNASQEFDLNEKEKNIISSHMWPLTIMHLPKSKEAWIVSVADKICAVQEVFADAV